MSKAVSGYEYWTSQAWKQVIQAMPTSYTCWLDGSTYRAEANIDGLSDLSDASPLTVLQNAVSALTSGGKIFIHSGDWRDAGDLNFYMADNVVLVGEERDSVVLGSTNSVFIARFNGTTNSGIYNVTFNEGAAPAGTMAVYVYGANPAYLTVDNVAFTGMIPHAAIVLGADCSHINVTDCYCGGTNIGYFIHNSGGVANKCRISGNTVEDTVGAGMYLGGIRNSSVTHNHMVDAANTNSYGMIFLQNHATPQGVENVTISNNTVHFTQNPTATANGILLSGEGDDTFLTRGISVNNNTVMVDTTVNANVGYGIYSHGYDGTHHTVDGFNVNSNTVICDGTMAGGYCFTYTDRFAAVGNILRNTGTCTTGVYISDSDDSTIHSNVISGATAAYVLLAPANLSGDGVLQSEQVQINGATTIPVMTFTAPAFIIKADLQYTTAVANDTNVTVGYARDGAADTDAYVASVTSGTGNQWATEALTLASNAVTAGDTVTFTQDGSGGAGEYIRLILGYVTGV